MRVGIDLVKISRIGKANKNEDFVSRVFCEEEIEYHKQKGEQTKTLAGMFACKEAFLKAIGNGVLNGIDLREIKVLHEKTGKPILKLNKKLKTEFQIKTVCVSISHDGSYATAICILD